MDDIHRVAIQKNYKELVSKVNLNELLPNLIERRVFLYEQAENYRVCIIVFFVY